MGKADLGWLRVPFVHAIAYDDCSLRPCNHSYETEYDKASQGICLHF